MYSMISNDVCENVKTKDNISKDRAIKLLSQMYLLQFTDEEHLAISFAIQCINDLYELIGDINYD